MKSSLVFFSGSCLVEVYYRPCHTCRCETAKFSISWLDDMDAAIDLGPLDEALIDADPIDSGPILLCNDGLVAKCMLGRNLCIVCEQQFTTKQEFEMHARTHRKVGCPLCNKVCLTGLRLISHIRNGHTPRAKPYQCPSCEKHFSTSNSLWVHKKTVHKSVFAYTCNRCGYGTDVLALLSNHFEMAGETHDEFKCDACNKVFTTHQNLDKHTLLFHTVQTCTLCNKEYSSRNNLLRHVQRSHGKIRRKNLSCPHCPKLFYAPWQLKVHMNAHNNTRLECSLCPYSTVYPQALKTHTKIHMKQYHSICDSCGKGFMNKSALKNHLAREHLGTSLACTVCEKTFYAAKYLSLHMECHQPDYWKRNHPCKLCGRRFLRRPMLLRHLKAHEGLVRSYKCTDCGKILSSSASLKDHRNIHTGLRPYICECGNAFARKNYLIAHIRTHTKERPFGCVVCGVRFSQRGALTMHLKKH